MMINPRQSEIIATLPSMQAQQALSILDAFAYGETLLALSGFASTAGGSSETRIQTLRGQTSETLDRWDAEAQLPPFTGKPMNLPEPYRWNDSAHPLSSRSPSLHAIILWSMTAPKTSRLHPGKRSLPRPRSPSAWRRAANWNHGRLRGRTR